MVRINKKRSLEIINSLKLCVDLKDKDLEAYFSLLRDKGNKLINNKKTQIVVDFFTALAHETRSHIINLLNEKDYCVCELEAILDISQSTISHHLKILEKIGLVKGIKRGYFTHYELIKEKFQEYLRIFFQEYNFIKF